MRKHCTILTKDILFRLISRCRKMFIPGWRGYLLCLMICQHIQAQETVLLGQNKAKWNAYQVRHLPEEMYVHTAKEVYAGGETIWLKIVAVDGFLHQPLAMSRIAYVELIDAGHKPVIQAKIGLKDGLGNGYLTLPSTLASGTYILRAYSNWMKNGGQDAFFEKSVVVLSNRARPVAANKPQISFYPEGGVLLENQPGVLAFEMKDAFGRGISCTGIILDNGHDSVASFRSYKNGIGRFDFIAHKGHTYSARVRFSTDSLVTDLPAAHSEGLSLRLQTTSASGYRLLVQSATGAADPRFSYVYLLVHTRGILKIATGAITSNGQAIFDFDRMQLGEGVSQAMIMDKEFNPVCERLLFREPVNHLVLTAATDKEKYARREKIALNISVSDSSRQPDMAHLSVAVFKLDSGEQQPSSQIDNYLLLQSGVSQPIDRPESYFSSESQPDPVAIDNLLLTKTSRRFSWQDIVRGDSPVYEPEVYGPVINGNMVSTIDGSPAKHISSYLSVPGRNTNFRPAETDGNGKIKFEMTHFTGNESVVFQTNAQRDSTYSITLQNPFSTSYPDRKYTSYAPVAGDSSRLTDRLISARLAEIFDTDTVNTAALLNTDTTYFYGKADESYLLDNFTRFTTMEEVMREYIVSVNVFRKSHKLDLVVLDLPLKRFFENEPLVLVDGVPYFDIDAFMHIDPLKIRKIELVTRPYFLGTQEYDGIVNCVTYHGDLDGVDLNRHARIIAYPGIQPAKFFHEKSYDTEAQQASRLPDFRDLLYWLPELSVSTTEKRALHFYASDLPGRYAILLQGITTNGLPASRTIFVTVTR